MAKRKRIIEEYDSTDDAGAPPNALILDPDKQRAAELASEVSDNDVDESEIEELWRVSDEIKTTAGIRLDFVRVLPAERAGYVGEMAPAEFTMQAVARKFGPGRYKIRPMGPRGFVKGGGSITIADTPQPPVAPPSQVSDLVAVLQADRSRGSDEWKDLLKTLLPIIAPKLIEVMFGKKDDVKDLIGALASLKTLQPEQPKPIDPLTQIGQMAKLMEAMKDLQPEPPPPSGSTWPDLVREGISTLRPLVEQVAAAQLSRSPGSTTVAPVPSIAAPVETPSPAGPTTSAPSTANPSPNGNNMLSLLPWLRATLGNLVVCAARDRDPELYANVVFDNIPDGTDPKVLRDFIASDTWWAQLCAFDSRVSPYQGWFKAFRDNLLEVFEETSNPVPPQGFEPEGED
jgi:hypothetical protein